MKPSTIKIFCIAVVTVAFLYVIFGCAQRQKSVFDTETQKFGFIVNHTDNYIEVWVEDAGVVGKVISPYWATVGQTRDYFQAISPKPWTNRDPSLDKKPDTRLELVPDKLLAAATKTNAAKLWLTPGELYVVKIRQLHPTGSKSIRLGEIEVYRIRLAANANTPFTLDYGLEE